METHTERILRHSEVMALVRAIRSGTAPRIGDSIDYFIEVPAALERRALARPQNKAQKPYRFEVEQTRSLGGLVLAVARHHGSGRASGAKVDQLTANLYTVSGAKIVRVELYASSTEALKSVGLEE